MPEQIAIHKYLPLAILVFFFNGFLLPLGLLYTTLLTPVFLIWLYRYPSFSYLWIFFLVTVPFVFIHLINGVDIVAYIKSYLLLFSVFVFGLAFYQFLRVCHSPDYLFNKLVLINFFLVLLAILLYFIPGAKELVWYRNEITTGVEKIYRLKLFTYEASYYSFLLAPIAIYFYLKILLFGKKGAAVTFWLITIPLLLSLSFGVIMALVAALFLLLCSDLRLLSLRPNFIRYTLTGLLVFCGLLFLVLLFFPDNVIFIRIENVFKGRDTSFSGRTFDSIYLGWKIAAQKSIFFGAGPGQTKLLGMDLFNEYYNTVFRTDQITIPNNIGDVIAQFGLLGIMLKLGLELYFFFKTKVFTNYYRLALFLFVFIYQFTGSFITNIVEYAIWLMAFCPLLFTNFNKSEVLAGPKAVHALPS
jgi:hypothetical protein